MNKRQCLHKKPDIERAAWNCEPGDQPCELQKNILGKGSWPLWSATQAPRNQKHTQIPLISTKQGDCNNNFSCEGGKQSEKKEKKIAFLARDTWLKKRVCDMDHFGNGTLPALLLSRSVLSFRKDWSTRLFPHFEMVLQLWKSGYFTSYQQHKY